MRQTTLRRIVLGLAATGLLGACVEGTGSATGSAGVSMAPGASRTGQEVEAPEIFQATDSALWDGRPSLGGTWVASPDAVDPERVVMFNPANGKSVTGALFRRERENPGPKLQLSSDAAEALGVLAGMPTEIRVTALRREDPPAEVEAVQEAPLTEEAAAVEDVPATGDAATAAAAVAALDAGAADAAAEAGAVDPATASEVEEASPKRKTWKEKRAEAKAAREAEKAAAAAAEAEAVAGAEVPVDPTAISGEVAAIETAPLDARTADPEPAAEPAKVEASEEAPAAVVADPAPGGRTIQIGTFSKEENANRAVEALSKIGITARSRKIEKDGAAVYSVVATGDAALLQKIKDAGFADAYFLK